MTDFQQTCYALAHCIDMQERWACAVIYLHDEGDMEAACEALQIADTWRDRAEDLESWFFTQR